MPQLPDGTIVSSSVPLLPLRNGVLFPGTVLSLPVGRDRSIAMLRERRVSDVVAVVAQRDAKIDDPGRGDLHDVGTLARIVRIERSPSGAEMRVTVEGIDRFAVGDLEQRDPYWRVVVTPVESDVEDPAEARALSNALRDRVRELARRGGALAELEESEGEPGRLADQIAAALGLPVEREIEILAERGVVARLRLVAERLAEARVVADVKRTIDDGVRRELGKGQREAILREQLKAIQKELGEGSVDDLEKLRARLDAAGLPPEARAVADRELARLAAISTQSPEHGVVRTYLEWIADLPWSARAAGARLDLDAIQAKLDADHFGLADVKKRILEHMAVLALTDGKGARKATILCLSGPPGVGKTSLGQSIADAIGRPLVRVALGGVGDEAELRGHRRTYVGALPGRLIHALKKAAVRDPVVLLDEIDKLGRGFRGSPENALLEILDPEQNRTFQDHYLELPFDLSEVLFVCTANDLGALSLPLRDRLEIIELPGYTLDEKVAIGARHLLPKAASEHALPEGALAVDQGAIAAIARDWTREAGVRSLGREITKLVRAVALEVARSKERKVRVTISEDDLPKYLGRPRFQYDVAERTAIPGVATGLAWTPVGGDILFVETSQMKGRGRLEITGQLGDVMKESAKAALTYVRSHARELGIEEQATTAHDLHVHVPAGAVPKDGPSAGVTIFTALTSLLTGRRVRPDTAMTGEVTLRGRVLPVGGIKAKVLAAHRAGIQRVILPAKNGRDLEDLPADVRASIEFVLAHDVSEVLDAALESGAANDAAPIEGAGLVGYASGGAAA
jgi:ATP-dependent Lon protease